MPANIQTLIALRAVLSLDYTPEGLRLELPIGEEEKKPSRLFVRMTRSRDPRVREAWALLRECRSEGKDSFDEGAILKNAVRLRELWAELRSYEGPSTRSESRRL